MLAALTAPGVLLGATIVAEPVKADINNPGAVTFRAVNGEFLMNKTDPDGDPPLSFKFPNTIGPWQCSDGIDNDGAGGTDLADSDCVAPPTGAVQPDDDESLPGYQGQFECNNSKDDDLNYVPPSTGGIDFLAGAGGAGVPKDANCVSINDNTEFFTTDPPAAYVAPTFTGTVAANGDVNITNVTFQKKWVHFVTGIPAVPLAHARVTFKVANLPITGHADPLTGEVTISKIDMAIFIVIQGLGNCELPAGAGGTNDPATGTEAAAPIASFSVDNLTTGTSGTLTGAPYNQTNGVAKLVRGDFGIPAANCASQLAEDSMTDFLNVPSVTGNDATFYLQSTPVLQSRPAVMGKVTNSTNSNPIAGAKVGLYSASSSGRLATDITDASGNYDFQNLTAGNYRLKAWDPNGVFLGEWNGNAADYGSAANIALAVGPAAVANFALDPGASLIEGRVRDRNAAGVAPLDGATVTLYDGGGAVVGVDTTGTGGWFAFNSLPAGDYKIKVAKTGYFTEWYQDVFLGNDATTVTTTSGSTITLDGPTTGLFLTRTTNPEISGNVHLMPANEPVGGATVRLYTASGQIASTTTALDGTYAFGGIAKHTNYYVRFEYGAGYHKEWFNEAGPGFNDCSGIAPPCTPTIQYADAIVYGGGNNPITNVNGTLDPVGF